MPKVKNKYKDGPEPGDKYIGRGSPFGNPFIIGKHGDRDEVCARYENYWNNNVKLQEATKSLKGHNLVCFCKPLRCHGDFLLRKANEDV